MALNRAISRQGKLSPMLVSPGKWMLRDIDPPLLSNSIRKALCGSSLFTRSTTLLKKSDFDQLGISDSICFPDGGTATPHLWELF